MSNEIIKAKITRAYQHLLDSSEAYDNGCAELKELQEMLNDNNKASICEWIFDSNDKFYETSCGKAWCFSDGGIKENNIKYCPFCGGRLTEYS